MKKLLIIISLPIALSLASCSGTAQKEESAPENTNNEAAIIEDAAAEFESTSENATQETMIDQGAAQTSPTTSNTQVKMNPPHGEPGHRCDVNVGEPLPADNAPAGVTNQAVQQNNNPGATSIMNAPANAAPATKTAAGMNPPHGEPGHDCAIPVGAPLNSK